MMKRKKKQILSYLPFLVIPKVQKEPRNSKLEKMVVQSSVDAVEEA